MPKILQFRRGTTGELEAITGAPGELFVDTTKDVVVVSDGVTAGGFPLQSELVSGTNIKTINGESVLGSGDITVEGGNSSWGNITGTLSNQTDLQNALNAKQDDLVSGTNIKTINGQSVLGSGDLEVSAVVDFSDISEDVLPMFSEVYDIGSADKRWYDGYFSNKVFAQTIDINGAEILGSEDGVVIPTAALIDQLLISDNMITPDENPEYEGQKGTLIVNGNLDVDGDWLGLPTVGSSITESYTETQNNIFITYISDSNPLWIIAFGNGPEERDAFLAQLQRSGLQYFELDDGFGNIYRFTFTGPPQASENSNWGSGVQFAQSSGTWNSTPPFIAFSAYNVTFVGQVTVVVPPSSTGSEGFLRYNRIDQSVEVYTTEWTDIGGGGGGVSQIIAGSGVTISPTGGTGAVTISAAGGGGGAIEEVGTCSLSSTGYAAGTCGRYNNFFGWCAGISNTIGCNNNFFGKFAGRFNCSGSYNNFLGQNAGFMNAGGTNNNFFGAYAGRNNTSGNLNNFFGRYAGCSNTTGSYNNFFGFNAGRSNTTGGCNTFFGRYAGFSNTTGSSNTFFGFCAGFLHTSGDNNNFFGTSAGFSNQGSNNNFFGAYTGYSSNTTGSYNNFFGRLAGFSNTSGCHNTFFGCSAGVSNTTGSFNLFMGVQAGRVVTTGCNNILLGQNAGHTVSVSPTGLASITTESNRIIMGNANHTCAQIQIAWTTVSDARDKCIYGSINRGLGFLKNVNPIEFAFKDRTTGELKDPEGKRRYGFSAQDILALEGEEPVIVSTENPDQLQMTNDYLIPILVNAVKELSAQLSAQSDQIQELKSRLDQLTS